MADAPHGPWSPPVARVELPPQRQGKTVNLVYCTYLHPELFRENGRVMVLTCSLGLRDSIFDANCEMVEIELQRENPAPPAHPPVRKADRNPWPDRSSRGATSVGICRHDRPFESALPLRTE